MSVWTGLWALTPMTVWVTRTWAAAQHHERLYHVIPRPGKEQHSKYSFYRMRIIFCAIVKLKNHQLNCFKSGTVSIMIENYKNCIDFFAQLYADKFEKWDKMHNFLEKYNVPKPAPNKTVSLKRSSFYRRNRKKIVRALSLINFILKAVDSNGFTGES